MGFLNTLKLNITNMIAKEVRAFSAGNVTPDDRLPAVPWLYHSEYGVPIRADIITLRQLAKSSWVQMVVNTIVKQVLQTEWTITVADEEEDLAQYEDEINKVYTFLNYPNRNKQTFFEVWSMFLRDVLEIDRGILIKGYSASGELVELFPVDGSRFLTKVSKYGIIEGYYQYSFYSPQGKPIYFDQNEVISGVMNPLSERFPYGFSPLQSVQQEVELLLQSTRYNKDFYRNNAVPDAIGVFDTDKEGLDRINLEWDQNVRGRAHKVLLTNAKNFEFKSMRLNNRDMEWLEGQKWYHHTVFGAYGLSPQEVGFYENSNRSTSEGQERTSVRNAIRPYMKMVADKINREIIPALIGNDHIIFKWLPRDTAQENTEHRKNMDLLDRGVLSVDEMRSILGYRAQTHTVGDNDDNIIDPQDNTLEAVQLDEAEKALQARINKWSTQYEQKSTTSAPDIVKQWADSKVVETKNAVQKSQEFLDKWGEKLQ